MNDPLHDGTAQLPAVGRSPRWVAGGVLVGIAAIVVLFLVADGPGLYRVIDGVDPWSLFWPFAATTLSYAAMAASYHRIAAAAGLEISYAEMVRITLVSTAANYLLSTGGLSGLAVRSYYFAQHHGLPSGNAVSISLAQTFITNLVLFAFLFWGLLNLLYSGEVHGHSLAVVLAFFALSATLCLAAVAVVASRRARLWLFAALMRIPNVLSRVLGGRAEGLRARLALFEAELHEGVDFLIARGRTMIVPVVYIGLDWFLMLTTLWAAFRCIHEPVPMDVVVIGFSTGVFLSLVNLVPGGLGIMEGSMSAVFASLGVPLESAVVATMIFRLSYYVIPLLVTLVLFRRMMSVSDPAFTAPEPRAHEPSR